MLITLQLLAQSFFVQGSTGPSVSLYDKTAFTTINASIGYEATPRLALLVVTSCQNNNIVPEQNYHTLFCIPAVKFRVLILQNTSISLLAGMGIGHSFTTLPTDHNFHCYLLSVPIEYAASHRLSLVIEPSFLARTWQYHIGFKQDYSQIGFTIGLKRYL